MQKGNFITNVGLWATSEAKCMLYSTISDLLEHLLSLNSMDII